MQVTTYIQGAWKLYVPTPTDDRYMLGGISGPNQYSFKTIETLDDINNIRLLLAIAEEHMRENQSR